MNLIFSPSEMITALDRISMGGAERTRVSDEQ